MSDAAKPGVRTHGTGADCSLPGCRARVLCTVGRNEEPPAGYGVRSKQGRIYCSHDHRLAPKTRPCPTDKLRFATKAQAAWFFRPLTSADPGLQVYACRDHWHAGHRPGCPRRTVIRRSRLAIRVRWIAAHVVRPA